MAKTVEHPCFSNGTEMEHWMSANCDKCYKSSRYKIETGDYTKSRCSIFDQVMTQYMGLGNEPVSERTYNTTQSYICPYRKEHWTRRKRQKTDKDKSLMLKFD